MSMFAKQKLAVVSVSEEESTDQEHVGAPGLLRRVRELLRLGEKEYGNNNGTAASPPLWKPAALRAPVLIAAMLLSTVFAVILEVFLRKSKTEGGIIFTWSVIEMSFGEAFPYLYLPTIIAVLYSIFWSWIDLDTKRFEPFHQLSKPGGASGKDSLLLQYPFDFIASVPIKALRRRHWPVMLASTAIVCVFWGLTPTQAGMFIPALITFNNTANPMRVSTDFVPLDKQRTESMTNHTYLAYGINWLGQHTPPYVGPGFAVTPFTPNDWAHERTLAEIWTAPTTQYSVDLTCESATVTIRSDVPDDQIDLPGNSFYESWNGCVVPRPFGPTGNETIAGANAQNGIKQFSAFYTGFSSDSDSSNLTLSSYCPANASHTFFVAFTKNKQSAADPPETPAALFCEPTYYSQAVNASILGDLFSPLFPLPLGPKLPINGTLFDTAGFERQLNSVKPTARYEIPGSVWPDMSERFSAMEISASSGGLPLHPILGIALGSFAGGYDPLPSVENLTNTITLQLEIEKAYQQLFAITIGDILAQNSNGSVIVTGKRTYTQMAVALDTVFTRTVQGLLGLTALLAAGLLCVSWSITEKLRFNPATIAATMSLVADNEQLLAGLQDFDGSTAKELDTAFKDKKYQLVFEGGRSLLRATPGAGDFTPNHNRPETGSSQQDRSDHGSSVGLTKRPRGVRPSEFRLLTTGAFMLFQIVLIVGLGVVYQKAKPFGLPRTKKETPPREEDGFELDETDFIGTLLYSILPIALATFIEPLWVVLNRQLCLLQPFEDLRRGNSAAANSIGVDYMSLPPQLVLWRALRSGHWVLALVCGMSVLANVLAVALGGLFYSFSGGPPITTNMVQPYTPRFASLEKSSVPSGSIAQVHMAMATNFTYNTILPKWTDDEFIYIPFLPHDYDSTNISHSVAEYEATTRAFGARLDCVPLSAGTFNDYELKVIPDQQKSGLGANLSVIVDRGDGTRISCASSNIRINNSLGTVAECPRGAVSIELVNTMSALPDASESERSFCEQLPPRLVTGTVRLRSEGDGGIRKPRVENVTSDGIEQYFADEPSRYITRIQGFLDQGRATWHNDSHPSDFMNYLMMKASNSTRMLDPSLPPPPAEEAAAQFNQIYAKLFALYLGTHMNTLLIPSENPAAVTLSGITFDSKDRIFVSKPMFIIAETILCTYVIVTIIVYIRRPERFLPRLPTTIASIIATFAASHAVRDFGSTAHLSTKERAEFIGALGTKYGYGSFIGTDGKGHVGIEKEPLMAPLKHSTSLSWARKRRFWAFHGEADDRRVP
ncbi:hypothetical protein H2199_006157 [Coniosporium tulheliwenetii]|uniref:Uncharacterized protein n=1 Tax=Coniosporium tulheliwenetii TaxID=3383036 RepID=A0ACC2YY36_9PEZI|nr:hypothetical protein H2199_006157 [Cladosporium sp. JES 115]